MKAEHQDVILKAEHQDVILKAEHQDVILKAEHQDVILKAEHQDVILKAEHQDVILKACGASSLRVGSRIQSLWSGYGDIVRVHLDGCEHPSVVVKHIKFPVEAEHPAGWNTNRSHLRKVRSYQVETHWYQNYSTAPTCRTPACLTACSSGDEMLIVLEDLDSAGYDQRRTSVTEQDVKACLRWLAHFHALFLNVTPEGLWPVGTYWHLDTRPDELEAMGDAELKAAAGRIDWILNQCRYKTLVHGDAKLANFCFCGSGTDVAAVDFQYVGGGCGMKDVVYFLGSCMDESECEKRVPALLDYYFTQLKQAVDTGVDRGVDTAVGRGVDRGVDTGVDRGVDTAVGRGVDRGVDTGVDRGVDTAVGRGVGRGVDTGVDRGVDTGVDRGVDRGVDTAVGRGVGRGVDTGVDRGVDTAVGRGVGRGVDTGVDRGVDRGVSTAVDSAALEEEWRQMFAFAWTDFHRFLLGWTPGHWKVNRYSKLLTKQVVSKLKL